jgi:hypothetical protein
MLNDDRPIIRLSNGLYCLVDTGAEVPVFTGGEIAIMKYFPDAKKIDKRYELSGFGKDIEYANVYKIPLFRLDCDFNDEYINIHDLIVACCNKKFLKFQMIISATMLKGMDYNVKNHKIGLNKQFNIETDKRDFVGFVNEFDRTILKSFVLSQDEKGNILE